MVVPVRSSMTSDGRAVETEKIRASTEGTSIFTCFSSSSEVVDLNEGMRSSLEGAAFASAKKAAIPASSSDTPPASRPDLGRPSAIEGTVGVRTALLGGSAEFPRPPSCSSVRTSNEVGGAMPIVGGTRASERGRRGSCSANLHLKHRMQGNTATQTWSLGGRV